MGSDNQFNEKLRTLVTNLIMSLSQMPNSALKEYQIKHISMLML